MNTEKLLTKDFIILFIINLFACLQFLIGLVVITPYAMELFHAPASIAGLVSGIYVIGALVGRFGTGRIITDYGSKKVLIIGSILYVATTALYLAQMSLLFLIIIRFLNGVTYGIVATTAAMIIAQIVPKSRQGEGISYYSLSGILAMAGGPFLAILLVQYTDYKTVFICNLIFGVLGMIISFTDIKLVQTAVNQVQINAAKYFDITKYIEFNVVPIGCIAVILGLIYSSVLTFLSLYAAELHLEIVSSYFFLICAIVVLLSRPFSGRLFDAKGANIVIYPGLVILAIGMFIYAQVSHGITLLLSSVLFGLGWGNSHSAAQSLAIKITPPERYGVATATYFILYEMGLGLGPYFCGYLVQILGISVLYVIMGFVTIAAIVLYYFLQGRKEKTINPN